MTRKPEGRQHAPVAAESWGGLESALSRIPGVVRVHVEGQEYPSAIHVVTTGDRPPKNYVRDVQSMASATLGTKIDYRVISVVQMSEDDAAMAKRLRPWLERVTIGSKESREWVEVSLGWPDGKQTEGLGAAGRSKQARVRGAAAATIGCLDKALAAEERTAEVTNVELHRIEGADWVLVHAYLYERDVATPLLGSAIVLDDVASAAARAVLDALNRKLFGS